MASLLSVNVGLPKDVGWQGRTVHTGIWKRPVDGPRMVRRLNIDGDGQGDLNGHGGEQRAVLVYQIESYRHWQEHLGRDDFEFGQFGENFTVDGLGDDEVCIGDRYRIGDAEFEVTQPRVTCFRVGMRLGEPRMPALLVAHHRPGFYLRVIVEGQVQAGDEIVRTRVGRHALSVADDRRAALPARPRHRAAPRRGRHPRAQPGLAAVVPRAARRSRERNRGRRAGHRRGAGLGRLPPAARRRARAGDLDGDVGLPDRRRRQPCRRLSPGSTSPCASAGRRRSGTGAQLLALVEPRRRHLPDQRQARTARRRQHATCTPGCGRAPSSTSPRRAASSC